MKSKISAFWKKLDVFCKISVIALALVVILTIVAIIVKNVFAILRPFCTIWRTKLFYERHCIG